MANEVRCPNGHIFSMSVFQTCPYCGLPAASFNAQQMPQQTVRPMPSRVPMAPAAPQPPVQAYYPQPVQPSPAYYTAPQPPVPEADTRKVAGWLIGIDGPSKGKAYTIRENKNYVGRSASNDIMLADDHSVSREKHAVIVYVPKQRIFIAQPGESRELFYVNDDVVLDNLPLKDGDLLEIGRSKLRFLPLCGSEFGWDDVTE